jgi:hypothetical protein
MLKEKGKEKRAVGEKAEGDLARGLPLLSGF